MVAQEFAIEHTDRTLTITSMMSSGNIVDKELPKISKSIVIDLIKIGFKYGIIPSEKNTKILQWVSTNFQTLIRDKRQNTNDGSYL